MSSAVYLVFQVQRCRVNLYNRILIAYTDKQSERFHFCQYQSEYTGRGLRFYHMRQFKVIVEKHPNGYVAYPLGLKGVVVGEGDTYEEALADVKSAIQFHFDTFGREVFDAESVSPVLVAFVAEAGVTI